MSTPHDEFRDVCATGVTALKMYIGELPEVVELCERYIAEGRSALWSRRKIVPAWSLSCSNYSVGQD